MKVLILANNDVGLYKFRKELIAELLKKNEVYISLPYGKFVDSLIEMGCKFIETKVDRRGMNPIKDLKLLKKYKRICKDLSPDYVITYTIKPNVYGGLACRKQNINYAVNITGLGTAFQKKGFLNFLVSFLYKKALKNANVVFFENEGDKRKFEEKGIITNNQGFLLNGAGVNLDTFSFCDYPLNEGEINFLFIGRVMKEKGINELFVATKRIFNEGIKVKLDIVGGYEENYKELIEKYQNEGWLDYHGFQDDVRPFIEKCDCFILPSWHEGMANTNLECAASGRPVITSDIHGCKEAVIDGVSGILTKEKDAENLYYAMKKFCALSYEKRKQMGIEGRKHMEKNFDKKMVVTTTIEAMRL